MINEIDKAMRPFSHKEPVIRLLMPGEEWARTGKNGS